MPDISTVLAAIKTRLATINGLEVRQYVPPMPVTSMAVPALGPIEFDETMGRGLDTYQYSVVVLIDRADAETAASNLVAYANPTGTSSIKAALEGGTPARTLGGVVSTCTVTEMREPGVVEYGDIPFLFAEFVLKVVT